MVSLTRPAINNGDKDRYLPSLSSPNLRRTTAVFRRHSSRIEVDFSSASYGHKTPGNLWSNGAGGHRQSLGQWSLFVTGTNWKNF